MSEASSSWFQWAGQRAGASLFGALSPSPPAQEVPTVRGLPLVGSLVPIMREGAMAFLERTWRARGDTFRVRIGGASTLCVVHPDAIEELLVRRREHFIKGPTYDGIRLLTGDGLLTLEGEPWRRRRRLEQPAFHKESLRGFVSRMSEVTTRSLAALRGRLPSGGVVDAHAEMMRLTLEVVADTLLGQPFGADRTDASAHAFGDALELLSHRGNLPVTLPRSWPTPGNLKLGNALALLDTVVYGVIAKARARGEVPAGCVPTLLDMLLGSRDADTGEALSDVELRNEVLTLVLAGHETTALLLTWAFTLLGVNPDVVARLRAERSAVLGGRAPTADDLPKLVYMGQVIDEVLRLRPPAWALARDVSQDDTVGGAAVRAGERVMPLLYLTHRHPAFWQDPERFDPERFTADRVRARPLGAYVPFSLGPRMCIGNLFTLAEAKVILAQLLHEADFELASVREVPPVGLMTMRPASTVRLRLRWRKGSSARPA